MELTDELRKRIVVRAVGLLGANLDKFDVKYILDMPAFWEPSEKEKEFVQHLVEEVHQEVRKVEL
jgi:hypothetical protein